MSPAYSQLPHNSLSISLINNISCMYSQLFNRSFVITINILLFFFVLFSWLQKRYMLWHFRKYDLSELDSLSLSKKVWQKQIQIYSEHCSLSLLLLPYVISCWVLPFERVWNEWSPLSEATDVNFMQTYKAIDDTLPRKAVYKNVTIMEFFKWISFICYCALSMMISLHVTCTVCALQSETLNIETLCISCLLLLLDTLLKWLSSA